MTLNEAQKYWMPAKRIFGPDYSVQRSQALAALLGLEYPKGMYWRYIELTPELKSQLAALAGPHGAAIKKAMEIRNGTETKEAEV